MADYEKLKVTDLKDLIKERGIASTGLKLKQQFIDALVENDNAENGGDNATEKPVDDEPAALESEEKPPEEPVDDEIKDATIEEKGAVVEGQDEPEDAVKAAAVDEDSAMKDVVSSNGEGETTNKRKRRSPTPPLREESVAKKLKTQESTGDSEDVQVTLPEDLEDSATAQEQQQIPDEQPDKAMDDVQIEGPSSKHPPTRALYIAKLLRPLQPNPFREHLLSLAEPSDDTSGDAATIELFHLDKIRSHALVLFNSRPAAMRVRSALHGRRWPDEANREELEVDFIPEDKIHEWVETETNRADTMTRWEVVYSRTGNDTDGPVVATLQEAIPGQRGGRKPSQPVGPARPQPVAGEGMPNAPSGPRRRSLQYEDPPQESIEPQRPAQDESFGSLDTLYKFTETKPKIYYKLVAKELSEKRLDEFERETSRTWDDADADPSAYAEGELRRYTFEDGDRIVDGGADFGLFGRRGRGGGGAGGGMGRGGRGGPRRGRGDYYGGSGRR